MGKAAQRWRGSQRTCTEHRSTSLAALPSRYALVQNVDIFEYIAMQFSSAADPAAGGARARAGGARAA
eukprot:COSAG02_NODE_13192_length_1429_cov_1.529323_3_plen_67_part_01